MADLVLDNPFLALFASREEATLKELSAAKQKKELCALLTRIFLFTGTGHEGHEQSWLSSLPRYLVHLPQLAKEEVNRNCDGTLSLENYLQGLDERLLLLSSDLKVLDLHIGLDKHSLFDRNIAIEPSAMKYLAECYTRAENESKSGDRKRSRAESEDFSRDKTATINQCKREIVARASIVIRTDNAKALIQSSNSTFQFVLLMKSALSPGSAISVEFFHDVAQCQADNLEALKVIFDVVLEDLYSSLAAIELSSPQLDAYLNMVEFFASRPVLCKVLIKFKHWLPSNIRNGKAFETQTILGRILSPSCMAELPQSPSSYFPMDRRMYRSEVEETTISVRYQLDHLTMRLYKIFEAILRASSDTKKALITWLVLCFSSNNDRGKMASLFHQAPHHNQAKDGFFTNLSWIMLRLCSPFMVAEHTDATRMARVKAIAVSYCACSGHRNTMSVSSDTGGPLVDFSGDSKLVPCSDGAPQYPMDVPLSLPFNFITHCFFLTHKCLMLGMTHVLNKYQDIRRNLSHLHHMIGMTDDFDAPPPRGTPQWFFRSFSSQVLAIQAHALHPVLLELSLSFYATTAQWMVQQVVNEDEDFIPEKPPAIVQIVPECLVENMSNIVIALRQMDSQLTLPPHHIHSYLSFCTVYMRSSNFINNPHIRAKLAQLIRFIIHKDEISDSNLDIEMQRELFSRHTMAREHLVTALFSIFVDIEHTGDSMEFEDKFAYRLPMYDIIEFLWSIPAYQASIGRLSEEVVTYSEATQTTPVFLRFINMIINDAIVQLDEGLENLTVIRELENLKSSDEWPTFSDERKKELGDKLKEAVMYATNRNRLSDKTVHMLKVITADVRKPFLVAGIVDRMAAMLNYVLKHLVGKASKNFKVKDADKYHFSPRTLVRNIVEIYINLGKEECFCEALPRDGRSFSMDLFAQAERVLRIIATEDQESIISQWRKLSVAVKESSADLLLKEALLENAPDEFLDPFTQELMIDPVTLPTSGHIVDRSSIMRHLLSDQQDPFNRASLTPDMLQTNHDLRDRIRAWKKEKLGTE